MWKAFSELETLGLIGPERPKIICVQAEATQPLVIAMEKGLEDTIPAAAGDTLAYGVNVPGGVGHFRVLEIIRESEGAAIAVPEVEIHATLSSVWLEKGWWICPEGAACLAAIPQLLDSELIREGDRVVAFNTGSLEKYLPDLRHLL
jgi:threonine synthase